MLPGNIKIGQRWLLKNSTYHRIEEITYIAGDRSYAKVVVKQCLSAGDLGLGKTYDESFFDSVVWTLLEGQEAPTV